MKKHLVASLVVSLFIFACAEAPSSEETLPGTTEESIQDESSLANVQLLGRGSVFARVPSPGFPEGIVVVGEKVYVSGPATLGTAGSGPSKVWIYNRLTGAAEGSITLQGELLSQEHALSCITSDAQGRLYVLSTQLGVVRLTPTTTGFSQQIYAPPPADLQPCGPGVTGACSPTIYDGPPLVNDLAFDAQGNLYVTDSFQATVFRVPPGGGSTKVWFQDAALAAAPFSIGLNGIRISPDQSKVYLTVSSSLTQGGNGVVYTVPRVAAPAAADLKVFHTYTAAEGVDGIAFGVLGNLYVALAYDNSISVLKQDGTQLTRYRGPVGSTIPFDAPANIAFDLRGNLLVTNHAVASANANNFAVLKVFAAALPFPLNRPNVP